jgi:hypothetical protein
MIEDTLNGTKSKRYRHAADARDEGVVVSKAASSSMLGSSAGHSRMCRAPNMAAKSVFGTVSPSARHDPDNTPSTASARRRQQI